jgi:dephospho-CoA kinase
MLKIGLTGGIGSGKSVVANIFKVLGIPVFDADFTAKKIMEEDEELITSIKKHFGEEAYSNNKLNRKFLSEIVFSHPHQLEILNSITHPAAIKAAKQWMQQQTSPYIIKEAALLFESGSVGDLDFVIGVFAPQTLRIQRVMKRSNLSREEVLQRINKQIDETIKMKLCDFVITNDEQQLLMPQVLQLHEQFLKMK